MPTLQALLSVTVAGLALSITPGPSMLYVLSQSVGQSRAAGLASAVGLCLGGILLAIATAFGLATIFSNAPWLAVALRYIGSAYLIWLGIGMLKGAWTLTNPSMTHAQVDQKPILLIMWQGMLVELLNPKTVLFFALFLPPFVEASAWQAGDGDNTIQLLILGALIPLSALPSDILVACLGHKMTKTIKANLRMRVILVALGGLILIGIAVSLHIDSLLS